MNSSLFAQVEALRSVLKTTPIEAMDASTRATLSSLHKELGERLAGAVVQNQIEASPDSAIEHLEEVALRFEAAHPAVGTAIREAINTLVKAGM